MNSDGDLTSRARALMEKLGREAVAHGYNLNPDEEITMMLCEGLITNQERHGYVGCPCRLMEGKMDEDLDVICPCDYRDADLDEHGTCYCALYVTEEVVDGKREIGPIPERRPDEDERTAMGKKDAAAGAGVKVHRCKVCGYLCGREAPPGKCPICGASKERFEDFSTGVSPKVFRCKVCGYLCSRPGPPESCPICKAGKERFEGFSF